MKVKIRTGLEIIKDVKTRHVFCKNVTVFSGDSESNETALFLCQAFQDLEDGKITSVLITREKDDAVIRAELAVEAQRA